MRVIINADDCGLDKTIDLHIKNAIEKGKITSTTIMANLYDLNGAISLYDTYHNDISFGIHLNLTTGQPLLESKVLIDYGYYTVKDDGVFFDGKKANSCRRKLLPTNVKKAIYEELAAQITKIRNEGVAISHIDSHHHIHTSPSLIGVITQISKDFNIPKVRRMRNYVPFGISYCGRQIWSVLSLLHNKNCLFTKYFASTYEFLANPTLHRLGENDIIELMVHPGNPGMECMKEEDFLLNYPFPDNMKLINYNEM